MSTFRNIPSDFDEKIYLKLNPDVDAAFNDNPHLHYENYGFFENRKYKVDVPKDFVGGVYLKLNPDLKEQYLNNPIDHYLNYGFFENRKYKVDVPEDFNNEIYLKLHPDIREKYSDSPIDHYCHYGYFENRKYKLDIPDDFNDEVYLKLYPDLKEKYSDNPRFHYCNFGYLENRLYKVIEPFYFCDVNNYSILEYKDKNLIDINLNYSPIYNLDLFNSLILIIDFPRYGGGTNVFLNSILTKYKYKQTFLIARNFNGKVNFTINDEYIINEVFNEQESINFINYNKDKIQKIFVNHILDHSTNFINSLFLIGKEVTTITHDFFLLSDNPQPYYEEITKINTLPNKLDINKFDNIIFQNIININFFEKFYVKNKIINSLPDFAKPLELVITNNSQIIIGIIGDITVIKGKHLIEELCQFINKNNINIKIIIFGSIDDNIYNVECYRYHTICHLNDLLKKFKPNVILETSIWPETYSYTLTLSMITNLPIISFKKNFDSVISNRLSSYNNKYFFETIPEAIELVNNYKQNYFFTIEPKMYFSEFWDNYFITRKDKISINGGFKNNIKPYFIYFPQFHLIEENNITFYPNFSDAANLQLLVESNLCNNIETPFLSELNITSIDNYNLKNKNLIQRQIDLIDEYNIPGFAIYYYWFTINTITNKNVIMEDVINIFFDENIDIKNKNVFFIWANEDWSNNPAFGSSNEKIENIYNYESIKKNVDNLMKYFKNNNYLKIDNKPVFFIYHPWFLSDSQIDYLFNILDNECKINNFNGVHLVLNSMNKRYDKYQNFYINFNYKNKNTEIKYLINDQIVLDYKKYVDDENNFKDEIQTIVFDFDNRARLIKPNKLNFSTICINNTEVNKLIFINKVVEKYNKKKSEIENILLINAWNEWGEKMTFEPSKEYGFYNLNLLMNYLKYKEEKIIFENYPNLFHKYNNNLANINDNISIEQINPIFLNSRIITHIHCLDLNVFEEYFAQNFHKFIENSIICTFCIQNENVLNIYKDKIYFLKIENKGYDIGGKICCIKFLTSINYYYDAIIFIHSKKNIICRDKYINPIINLRKEYIENMIYNKNVLGIFPSLIRKDDVKLLHGTNLYRHELFDFLGCNNKEDIFVEGNCMILHKKVIKFIFFRRLELFYNLCNDINSFDINWCKYYYYYDNLIKPTNDEIFENYKKNHLYGNDFQPMIKNDRFIRDCMIEHTFERIWLNVIKQLKGEYFII